MPRKKRKLENLSFTKLCQYGHFNEALAKAKTIVTCSILAQGLSDAIVNEHYALSVELANVIFPRINNYSYSNEVRQIISACVSTLSDKNKDKDKDARDAVQKILLLINLNSNSLASPLSKISHRFHREDAIKFWQEIERELASFYSSTRHVCFILFAKYLTIEDMEKYSHITFFPSWVDIILSPSASLKEVKILIDLNINLVSQDDNGDDARDKSHNKLNIIEKGLEISSMKLIVKDFLWHCLHTQYEVDLLLDRCWRNEIWDLIHNSNNTGLFINRLQHWKLVYSFQLSPYICSDISNLIVDHLLPTRIF
jgi:hypothetical protein